MQTGAVMAKRKAVKPKGATRVEYLQFRMSGPFKDWLGRYAVSRNLSMADVIAQDLIAGAKASGFEPPPRR